MKKTHSNVFNIDPRKIDIMQGFNQRIDFGDINELAAQIKEQGLLEAISVGRREALSAYQRREAVPCTYEAY